MNVVNIEQISKIYGEKTVFDHASFGIQQGDKIGIVGINGTGKSTLLKMIAGEEEPDEGQIVCGDIHPHRVALIEQGAKRLGLHILETKVMDAAAPAEAGETPFDGVLCDVPCSGYGVMGRKSDIKARLDPSAMDTLIPLQQEILQCAARKVRSGGRLVYSTCTLNRKENEKQAERFLQTHPSFCLEREQTFFPHVHGTDGFYIARFLRKA